MSSVQQISSSQFLDEMINRNFDIIQDKNHILYQELLNILEPLKPMNLLPEHYTMFLLGLSSNYWKNLFRHLTVKWYQLKNQESITPHEWSVSWTELRQANNDNEVILKVINSIKNFLTSAKNKEDTSFRYLFIINGIHNYFIPL